MKAAPKPPATRRITNCGTGTSNVMTNVVNASATPRPPMLLELRSAEPHDRPCEHGERSGTCALHDGLRERLPSVADVRGA